MLWGGGVLIVGYRIASTLAIIKATVLTECASAIQGTPGQTAAYGCAQIIAHKMVSAETLCAFAPKIFLGLIAQSGVARKDAVPGANVQMGLASVLPGGLELHATNQHVQVTAHKMGIA